MNALKKLGMSGNIHDIANTIFTNGVSTVEQITELAGRGVGMDAVKAMLEQQGASIAINF